MNNRYEIKATAYLAPIRQWALATGERFFTWNEIRKAIAKYENFISLKN
jgi:hypothetical protein